ncbi:MAG: pyridoxal-phosphate-dependent aminotransferase family protein, partial [Candidatus Rokuibacteriota bacterium]
MIHYDASFDEGVLEPTTAALQRVFQTRHEVIVLPGSGRTGLEAAAMSIVDPGDPVLVVIAGVFGALMREIVGRVGAAVTEFVVEPGRGLDLDRLEAVARRVRPKAITLVHNETSTGATYPVAAVGDIARGLNALFLLDVISSVAGIDVRPDDWNVDLCMGGSQKCLAAPLGLALVAVSERAWTTMAARRHRPSSYVYDLLRWKQGWIPAVRGGGVPSGGPRLQPVSMPTHLIAALRAAVSLVLEEGLPNRFQRHAVAAGALQAGLTAMGLAMFPEESLRSNTVSCAAVPSNIVPAELVAGVRDGHGILIGTGLDQLRASVIRMGTMGLTASPRYVLPT